MLTPRLGPAGVLGRAAPEDERMGLLGGDERQGQRLDAPSSERTACLECDLMVRVGELRGGQRAACPRCRHVLTAPPAHGLTRPLAFALAACVLPLVANAFPFLALKAKVKGLEQVMTLPRGDTPASSMQRPSSRASWPGRSRPPSARSSRRLRALALFGPRDPAIANAATFLTQVDLRPRSGSNRR
jgi:hypothetical protein